MVFLLFWLAQSLYPLQTTYSYSETHKIGVIRVFYLKKRTSIRTFSTFVRYFTLFQLNKTRKFVLYTIAYIYYRYEVSIISPFVYQICLPLHSRIRIRITSTLYTLSLLLCYDLKTIFIVRKTMILIDILLHRVYKAWSLNCILWYSEKLWIV